MESANVVLVIVIIAMVVSIFTFIFLSVRAGRREMYLCAALIKQMEATQQAERKSMNKNLAFASANHDIRASLSGIIGLIELCHEEAAPGSDLDTNLLQAQACTKDLLGILNSILDASKIEAGKMQVEREEFDLEQLVEDVVDLYHPVGLKKGVDVVLDLCDGSITKCSQVKGDRGKLKQILCNLLSNAVKFTSEGHVSVRVWARKPPLISFDNQIFNDSSVIRICMPLPCLYFQNNESRDLEEVLNNNSVQQQQDQKLMEFIFEVNDTGKGIPKEMRKTVFENYVQIKEAVSGQEGTGLGLGIVQSLVRLMGGEIGIADKEIGEKGTCFRFNTFLSVCPREDDTEESHGGGGAAADYLSSDSSSYIYQQQQHHCSGQSSHGIQCRTKSRGAGSQVILFISGDERSRITQKFMEGLGIKVSVVKQYQDLPRTLKKIKENLVIHSPRRPTNSDHLSSTSDQIQSRPASSVKYLSSIRRSKEVPLSALDGRDGHRHHHPRSSHFTKSSSSTISNLVLIVIDTSAGPFREISRAVAEFRRDLIRFNTCSSRVVWISRSINILQGLDADKLPPTDLIISKPLHGSRLYQLIGLLPEFGGAIPAQTTKVEEGQNLPTQQEVEEMQEIGYPHNKKLSPLSGKKVLVAEDNPVLRKLAITIVSRLGADVYPCQNGEEALGIISQSLSDNRKHGGSVHTPPFDYILMDCEMPVMDGYESTRRIREEEKYYGVHMPIIALTAHTEEEETNKMIEAGMDYHLSKPLRQEQLLEAILNIHGK